MKKVTSLLLALVMALALAVPAFAENITPNQGEPSKNVEATYTAPKDTEGAKVYYFTVTWTKNEKMDLTYTGEDATYTWDGSTMKYTKAVNNADKVGWTGSAGYTVTITNQSNDSISAATSAKANFNLKAAAVGTETATPLESAAKGIDFTDTDTRGVASTKVVTYTFSNVGNDTSTAPEAKDVTDGKVIAGTISVTVTHA